MGLDNPKAVAALRADKAPLDLLEFDADCETARALQTGAVKYGRRNYRQVPIQASTYGAAIKRHAGAWIDGEDLDPESGLSHLAHVAACVHVLFGALAANTLVDDREPESA